jgi:excinuclease ABC subunit C
MLEGFWQEPVPLDFSGEESRATSLDHELRDRLSEALSAACSTGKRVEDLAIFSRWYYSSWRDGEWFPFRTLADLNYRRLVRQISNLVKIETA